MSQVKFDFDNVLDDAPIVDDEPLLTRSQFAEQYYQQMGCASPIEARTKLVSLAARKLGPPYVKLNGRTSPALTKFSWFTRWAERGER